MTFSGFSLSVAVKRAKSSGEHESKQNSRQSKTSSPYPMHKYSGYVNMSSFAILLKSGRALFCIVQGRGKPNLDFGSGEGYIYDMFEAVCDVVHGNKQQKRKFVAKCMKCGRLNLFRPQSKGIQFTAIRCNNCGSLISFGARGKESAISERAEIFCENCEDDCRQCPINKLTNEQTFSRRRHNK